MKAITTRYIGATERRPARIIASDLDGNRVTLPADGPFPYDDTHRAAAVALCAKLDWPGAETLVGGLIKHGMVWVFTHDRPERTAPQPPAGVPPTPRRRPRPCGDTQPFDFLVPRGPCYRCTLAAGHPGAHVDERNPMHPTWPAA